MTLEDFPAIPLSAPVVPRGSLVVRPGGIAGLRSEVWVAGAASAVGQPLDLAWFAQTWVIDCAGDMPPEFRAQHPGRWEACIFPDVEARPDRLERLMALISEFGAAAKDSAGPARLVAICHHGMNRSGLVAALILRELGVAADEALQLVRAARPGAIANHAFESLIRE